MLGSSEEEMCNMDLLEITHPDDRAMNLAYLQEARAGKIDQYTLEKRYCKKDGDELWARIYSSMVRGADNQILFIISMVEDITESQKIRQELQHALEQEKELSELKSRFVTMTSHEFRTPLSTILSSAELLEHYSHRWSDQKKVDHLRRIQTAVKHLTGMLDEVLVIGRVEAGMVTVDLASLDLLEVMADLVEEISLGVGAQHEIHFTCPEASFLVRMDEGLLRQILLNLLTNAVKYSPAGSRIDLELRRNDGQILIQISDEGVGIPDEDLSRLFEPFYRGQNTNHIPGTGLGLAIVKRSLDHLHGTITVNSQERVGTTFIVEIPIPAESDDDSLDLTGFLQD
jgi:PAS domain S-box-containing protein